MSEALCGVGRGPGNSRVQLPTGNSGGQVISLLALLAFLRAPCEAPATQFVDPVSYVWQASLQGQLSR